MILTWLLTLITFALGYIMGSYKSKSITEIKKEVSHFIKPSKVGAVKPITVERQERLKNKERYEGEKAMEETLDELLG
jgi:hypothetical protein